MADTRAFSFVNSVIDSATARVGNENDTLQQVGGGGCGEGFGMRSPFGQSPQTNDLPFSSCPGGRPVHCTFGAQGVVDKGWGGVCVRARQAGGKYSEKCGEPCQRSGRRVQ